MRDIWHRVSQINPIAPKRGRPVTVDRARVCVVALRLFEKKGFDAVTMEAVADAAKVSRRTLFRQFPSKADLVWDDLRGVLDRLHARLGELGEHRLSLPELMGGVMTPTLRWLEQPKVARLARRRLRLINATPALLRHPMLAELQGELTKLVRRAPGLKAPPELVTASLLAVGFGSILWWAEAGQRAGLSPLEAFEQAVSALASALP